MFDETVRDIERQRRKDAERAEREAREEAYQKAAHSASFKLFDTVMGTITVLIAAGACLIFLWQSSKVLFCIVVVALILSYVFRELSKYYFIQGEQKKFETFNKLAGIMGVSASVLELADYQKGKLKGAFSKMESLESSLTGTLTQVTSVCRTGGIYVDPKYDPYRQRCVSTGRFVYYSGEKERVQKVLVLVKDFENTHDLPRECLTCVNTLYMYADDFMCERYEVADETLALACIGALHFFVKPLKDIPDSIPIAGFKDNMFMPLCVTGGYIDQLNEYKDWKVRTVREKEVQRAANTSGELIQKLRKRGEVKLPTFNMSILRDKQHEVQKLNEETRAHLLIICQLVNDYTSGQYPYLLTTTVHSMVGAIEYWLDPDDTIPDTESLIGYVDDEIVIDAVYNAESKHMEEYIKWRQSKQIEMSMDPLIDYLNNVIGDNVAAREDEIDRLSSVCPNDDIVGREARARAVVMQLL